MLVFFREKNLARFLGIALSLAMAFVRVHGQSKELHSNLDVFRDLAREIASSVARQPSFQPSATIQLEVFPKETAWYIESVMSGGLRDEGFVVGRDSLAAYVIEVGISRAQVIYSNIRRDGLFGPKLIDRTVGLTLSTKTVDRVTGKIVESGDIEKTARDTIGVSEVSQIENPLLPITKGVLPSEGFFSNVAEPLILLGSIAVAVLLLFNVRS